MANQRDSQDRTALHVAAEEGHDEVLRALLNPKRGPKAYDRDSNGNTALHLAAQGGFQKAIEVLMADERHWTLLKSENDDGYTPLRLAATLGQEDAVRSLLDLGADPSGLLEQP